MQTSSFDCLPNGRLFPFWEKPCSYTKTYHVSAQHPAASDQNPGTETLPFLTINRAAGVLQPGERVLIGAGVYRECVRPGRGGESAEKMISYEAVPGATVIVSGAEIWQADWQPSTTWHYNLPWTPYEEPAPGTRVWMGELPRRAFDGVNPFSMINLPGGTTIPPGVKMPEEYWHHRGMLFVDGKPLREVLTYRELWFNPGTFYVEENDWFTIHLHLPGEDDPREHQLTFTAREQAFMPSVPYLGYLRVKGITFEHVGNGFPSPQRGALSTHCGHHWIIEENTIRQLNAIGMDIGHQRGDRRSQQPAGYHVVRNNRLVECGVCGICGVGGGEEFTLDATLVEHNRIERCGWHDVERYFESGGIKLHFTRDTLIRRNIVQDMLYGPGIWIDAKNNNSRICQNLVMNCRSCMFGAIFVEISYKPNLVDNNIVWGVKTQRNKDGTTEGGHGIYEHDCDYLRIENNLAAYCEGGAIFLHSSDSNRVFEGRATRGKKNSVTGNILSQTLMAIHFPTDDNFSDGNILGQFLEPGPLRIGQPFERLDLVAWRGFYGWETHGRMLPMELQLDEQKLALTIRIRVGDRVLEKIVKLDSNFDLVEYIETVRSAESS